MDPFRKSRIYFHAHCSRTHKETNIHTMAERDTHTYAHIRMSAHAWHRHRCTSNYADIFASASPYTSYRTRKRVQCVYKYIQYTIYILVHIKYTKESFHFRHIEVALPCVVKICIKYKVYKYKYG